MTPAEINAIGVMLASLRDDGEAAVVVAVAAHGPSTDMPEGCVSATVVARTTENGGSIMRTRTAGQEAQHSATAAAKYLADAIGLARADLRRQQARRAKSEEAARG